MKEYIYLGIIILIFLSRVIPFLIQGQKINKLLGYKVIRIKGLQFIIKKISPLDFIEDEHGFSLTFMAYAKGKTMWEQMRSDDSKMSEKDIENAFNLAKNVCEKSVVYWPGKLESKDFFKKDASKEVVDICWQLYGHVLAHNFLFFRKPVKIGRNYAIHVSELCAKFGTRPCDYMKTKGLTDVERYMIDNFFYNVLLEKENSITEKHNQALKRRKGRR